MNDIAISADALEKFAALERPVETEKTGTPKQFLKYNHDKKFWVFGAEDTKPNMPRQEDRMDGDQFIANVRDSLSLGWICWKDGTPYKTTTSKDGSKIPTMVPLSKGEPPKESELDNHGPYTSDRDGWKKYVSIELLDALSVTDDDPLTLLYEAKTVFGKKTLQDLGVAYADRMKSGNPEFCHPVVTLGTTTFKHKPTHPTGGSQVIPVITVVDWVNDQQQTEAQVAAEKKPKTIEGEVVDITPRGNGKRVPTV
jgi:hypothetical protein